MFMQWCDSLYFLQLFLYVAHCLSLLMGLVWFALIWLYYILHAALWLFSVHSMTSTCISASFCLAFWILWDTQSAKILLVSHKFQPVPGCIIFAWQIISFLDFYQRLLLQIYAFIKVLISFSKLHYWLLRLWWVAKSIVLSVLYLALTKNKI